VIAALAGWLAPVTATENLIFFFISVSSKNWLVLFLITNFDRKFVLIYEGRKLPGLTE
jgi:hypothetical protein